jgi:hypothetical protein
MISLDEMIVDKAVVHIQSKLRVYGLVIVPGYLTRTELQRMQLEFSCCVLNKNNLPSISNVVRQTHPTNVDGQVIRLNANHSLFPIDFPSLSATFNGDLIRSVAHSYYSPHKFSFNELIFITNEFECSANILPWHFDRIQSLKFWFYLTDTTKENGALEYCPGTHWEGRYRAGFHLSQGCPVKNIPNDIDESLIRNPVTIEAKAGDLIIFDADGFHRGGIVQPGKERRVIRAHSYPRGRRYGDKAFSPGWFTSSPLNINRWLGSSSSRVVGENVGESTINRDRNILLPPKTGQAT